jgi:nucleotide-binding universal stress UspA family protein
MTSPAAVATPIIDAILHPSDFSEAGDVAFAHALKAALIAKSRLTLLHASSKAAAEEWGEFPGVRETLERWGLIPPGSPKSAVPKLGIDVNKVISQNDDPVRAVLHYLSGHQTDLIVLATSQHDGRTSWLHKSVAEPIARKSGQMTLFVPAGVDGFVSLDDGSVSLTSVLIPVNDAPEPQSAVMAAARLARQLQCPAGTFTLLHIGGGDPTAHLYRPEVPGWTWKTVARAGDVTNGILETADETQAALLVMSTSGRHGFLDALRGSHSERVLRQANCPLLAVPEHSLAADALRI